MQVILNSKFLSFKFVRNGKYNIYFPGFLKQYMASKRPDEENYSQQDITDFFSTYNAKKIKGDDDDDSFASYNAKKTKLAHDLTDGPNSNVSDSFQVGDSRIAPQNIRHKSGSSINCEEQDLRNRLDEKRLFRDSRLQRSPGREQFYEDNERRHNKGKYERRYDHRENDRFRREGDDDHSYRDRRYSSNDRYHDDHRKQYRDKSSHNYRSPGSEQRYHKDNEESSRNFDHNQFRKVPAFIKQENEAYASAHLPGHRDIAKSGKLHYHRDHSGIRDHDYHSMRKVAHPPPAEECSDKYSHGGQSLSPEQFEKQKVYSIRNRDLRANHPDPQHSLPPDRYVPHPDGDRYCHPDQRPLHSDQLSFQRKRHPIHPDQHPHDLDNRYSHHDKRLLDPDEHPLHPDDRPLYPDVRPIHPDEHLIHPDERPLYPDQRPLHPGQYPRRLDDRFPHHEEHPLHQGDKNPLYPDQPPLRPLYQERNPDELRHRKELDEQTHPLYLTDQRNYPPKHQDVHGQPVHHDGQHHPSYPAAGRVEEHRHSEHLYHRPPPPDNYLYPQRDRFGPLNVGSPGSQSAPTEQKIPDLSDVAEIMKKLKENASKELESTKEMITNLIPPKPKSQSEPENKLTDKIDTIENSDISAMESNAIDASAEVNHIAHSSTEMVPTSTPEKKGKFSDMFSKTADAYKSNWVKTPEKEDNTPSSSLQEDDKERVIKLSGNLEVDLNEVNESQVNLIAKYLKHRTRGLRAVADFVPLRVKKKSENDEDESALDTVKSVRNAFNTIPKSIPGTITCYLCQKYNLPSDEYRRHVNTDFHCWMDGSWRYKITGHIARFSLIWCIICKDFFMLTFEGNTMNGHEDSQKHRKNVAIQRLHYNNVPKIRYCLLSELRTTKVKLLTPLKCKYIIPKEALNMYKAAYSKLCERHLVLD